MNNSVDTATLIKITDGVEYLDYDNDSNIDLFVAQVGKTPFNMVIAGGQSVTPIILATDINLTTVGNLPLVAVDPANDNMAQPVYKGALTGSHSVGQDGSFNYRITVEVPPGMNGMQPDLSLSYNSNRKNGLAGWGWGISGLSVISRCRASIVRDGYISGINTSDNYKFCLDSQRLVEIAGGEYRTESESFSRVKRVGGTAKVPDSWTVERKDGVKLIYGATADSAFADGSGKAMSWHINEQKDIAGNSMTYHYEKNQAAGIHRILRIEYGKNGIDLNNSVEFDYGTVARPDIVEQYMAGQLIRMDKRLERVLTKANSNTVKIYDLDYKE